MQADQNPPRGRGAADNPANRFEAIHYEPDPDVDESERPAPTTQFLKDTSRSIIARNDSPDVGFSASINPYRGCEHGCAYCYARPTHEYLGFSAGLDFESKIMVKFDAPELLRCELSSPRWQPQVVAVSGVTDCYQPIERKLQLTRRCLQVLVEFRNPFAIVTKNHLVARDIDLLREMVAFDAVAVFLSINTLDSDLARNLEPRATRPDGRLSAIRELSEAGVPAGVMVAPVIPGLNDHEIPSILSAAAKAGAKSAGYIVLRLPHAVAPLFERWLERHVPDKKERVLGRIRELRGGRLNDPNFGSRMRGEGPFAEMFKKLFVLGCRKAGIGERSFQLSTASFRRPLEGQLPLFEDSRASKKAGLDQLS
jgi:DNA repair photolyase